MPGPTKRDVLIWAVAVVVGAVLTGIWSLAGARLGSALTAGVIGLTAAIVGALAYESTRGG